MGLQRGKALTIELAKQTRISLNTTMTTASPDITDYDTILKNTEEAHGMRAIIQRSQAASRKAFFHLVPRYTSGSPAMVDIREACHVADGERKAYVNNLTGVFGDELKSLALTKGLGGIAYARWERGNKVFRLDLLTGIESIEPPRLTWEDCDRVRELRGYRDHFPLDRDKRIELDALEHRLEIHRDTVS
jgi:hypothetical protein